MTFASVTYAGSKRFGSAKWIPDAVVLLIVSAPEWAGKSGEQLAGQTRPCGTSGGCAEGQDGEMTPERFRIDVAGLIRTVIWPTGVLELLCLFCHMLTGHTA